MTGTYVAKRLAVFGGTFDPIHIGHLRSAIEVAEHLALDAVHLLPNAQPPHRASPDVSAQQRLHMVQLAVADEPLLGVDARELERDTPSWTIDTLIALRQELHKADQLFFILGWDSFCTLPSWHRWRELLTHCHLVVLQRPDMAVEIPSAMRELINTAQVQQWQDIQGPAGSVFFLQQTPLAVSATGIRALLGQGKSVRYLVPDTVLKFIHTQGLYQSV